MSGSPGVSRTSEGTRQDAQSRETVSAPERLAWQSELDSAMADIDSRLQHPRRRASDTSPQPTLPELGQVEMTTELLDEIAWRVAEQMRRRQAAPATASAPAEGASPVRERPTRPMAVPPPPAPAMPHGVVMTIRVRRPLFRLPWPFSLFRRHRRRHPLTIRAA
jgi:hypothetical protein